MDANATPQPGAHYNVSFGDYRAWPAINISRLMHGRRSMLHLRHAIEHDDHLDSSSMLQGRLAHCGILEPEKVLDQWRVIPDFNVTREDGTPYLQPKATKAYKALLGDWQQEHQGYELVTQAEYDKVSGMVSAVRGSANAMQYLAAARTEVSLSWVDHDTGIPCKCRVDAMLAPDGLCTDLKTTAKSLANWGRVIADRGYHLQMAWYARGISACFVDAAPQMAMVVVESVAPYGVVAAPMAEATMTAGEAECDLLLHQYAKCIEHDVWPGPKSPAQWAIPDWAHQTIEIDQRIGESTW